MQILGFGGVGGVRSGGGIPLGGEGGCGGPGTGLIYIHIHVSTHVWYIYILPASLHTLTCTYVYYIYTHVHYTFRSNRGFPAILPKGTYLMPIKATGCHKPTMAGEGGIATKSGDFGDGDFGWLGGNHNKSDSDHFPKKNNFDWNICKIRLSEGRGSHSPLKEGHIRPWTTILSMWYSTLSG